MATRRKDDERAAVENKRCALHAKETTELQTKWAPDGPPCLQIGPRRRSAELDWQVGLRRGLLR
eukprot:4224432-Prorocentrum_lima.AAC.1